MDESTSGRRQSFETRLQMAETRRQLSSAPLATVLDLETDRVLPRKRKL